MLAIVLSVSACCVGLLPVSAQAAAPQWGPRATLGQPVFRQVRPDTPVPRATSYARARYDAGRPARHAGAGREQARAGARKAVPVTRGQELGLRFRPDDRDPAYGPSLSTPHSPDAHGEETGALHSQFRPVERRRRPTYEELQQEQATVPSPVAPVMPYPMMTPPPLPGGGGYWPTW